MKNLDISEILAATFGMAGPIAIGVGLGHGRIGIGAALGGLALSGGPTDVPFRERIRGLFYALIAGGCAVFVGSMIADSAAEKLFVIPAFAATAALLGSITRPLARATTQFVLFMIIAGHTGGSGAGAVGMVLLFFVGVLWTGALGLMLRALFRIVVRNDALHEAANSPKFSARQLLRRWKRSLARLAGWQYTLRITACLIVAQFCEWLWPHRHVYWVAITVAIVVQRNVQAALKRTVQRAAGTTIGVLLAGLVMLLPSSPWTAIIVIAVLAAARPALIERNYTAYAAVMTPLVILLLDFGRSPSAAIVLDRLGATLVGCVLALTLGYLGWRRLTTQAPVPAHSRTVISRRGAK